MAGYISTDQYLWGLRRVLDGIAARVDDVPRTSAGRRSADPTSGEAH
jgi:hypothetical protein